MKLTIRDGEKVTISQSRKFDWQIVVLSEALTRFGELQDSMHSMQQAVESILDAMKEEWDV